MTTTTRVRTRPAADGDDAPREGRLVGDVTRPMSRRQVDGSGEMPFSRRRTRVILSLVAVLVVACLVGAFFVLPARAWLSQRAEIADAEADKDVLWEQIRQLEQRYDDLTQSSDDIERIARDQFGLARPGEQALSILPAPSIGELPDSWPFTVVEQILAARAGVNAAG
jgi:cell division protein FtsB